MAIQFVALGWHSMMGTLNPAKLVETYFLPNEFDIGRSTKIYPSGTFTEARRELYSTSGQKFELCVRISTRGYLYFRMNTETSIEDLPKQSTKQYSFKDFGIENKTIYESLIHLIYHVFDGRSISELYQSSILHPKEHHEFLESLGVTPLHDQTHINLHHYYIVNTETDLKGVNTLIPELHHNYPENLVHFGVPFSYEIPPLNGKIIFLSDHILYAEGPQYLDYLIQIHEGFIHYSISSNLMTSLLAILDIEIFQLEEYIQKTQDVSWIYVQERMTELQHKYDNIIREFKLAYTNYRASNFVNYENLNMIENLARYYQLHLAEINYSEYDRSITRTLDQIRNQLANKDEQEEQEATNNLIQIIGILAIVEVISELLNVFDPTIVNTIRLSFLGIIFPLLLYVWIRPRLRRRRRKELALQTKNRIDLQFRYDNIKAYKQQIEQSLQSEIGSNMQQVLRQELERMDTILKELKIKLETFKA